MLILLFIVSCKKNENIVVPKNNSTKEYETRATQEQYIVNDSLSTVMEKSLNELFKNPKFILEKELTENKHVDNQTDTIITYKWDKTYIKTYKTVSEEWVFEAIIQNSEFNLLNAIKTGIDKKNIERILKKRINSDIVKFGNLEQTSVFEFKFDKDLLKEINFEGYVD